MSLFKPKILTRFLMRRFFSSVGLVLFAVSGIIMAVTFVERLQSNPNAFATLVDAWTRLLEYVPMFLPIAVFMGTLLASYNLTRSSENVIIASAGLSPYQTARPFLVGAMLIGIFATTVINPYSVYMGAKNITTDKLQLVDGAIWLRDGDADIGYTTLNARGIQVKPNKMTFRNVTIFRQSPDFHMQHRIVADIVHLGDGELVAPNAHIWDINAHETTGEWRAETRMTPRTVLDRYLQPDQISFWALPGFIQKMSAVGVPMRNHLVQLWTLLFLPLTMIAMATLGVAFSQTHQRRNYSFGVKFALGIITCFAVYFLVNMFNALGATGVLPPMLAIIAPPLIIIAGAGAFIASFDNI